MAKASPSFGSVPDPNSSKRTRDFLEALRVIPLSFDKCAEKVDKEATID
jgi:hypothetical protein